MMFPPEILYRDSSGFEVGRDLDHCLIMQQDRVIAAFVLAMRDSDCCLIDVRADEGAHAAWVELMFDHWHQRAQQRQARAMTGPVGAFAFITDGVSAEAYAGESIHIARYPSTIVDSFRRRGYVHAWSGTIWGRIGADESFSRSKHERSPNVRRGTWMNLLSTVRVIEHVLSTSFSSLPWHRGSGAELSSLARRYMLVGEPKLMLTGTANGRPAGAVLMYRDLPNVPGMVRRWPVLLRDIWLFISSRISRAVHVSVIGIVPEFRNSRLSLALFDAAASVMAAADSVTTSWIRDDNKASGMMARRAGLLPLERRTVFTKELPFNPFTNGERE
ncbi:MAG: hypothetical protein FGM33_05365 [Candidatus Kapabacteria bacterium]|nr:hypothetical protein [Candidatus Kapabacteria bacterium]